MDLRLNSWDFYIGFGNKKFQTTNISVVMWFWMNSMLVLEVLLNREVVRIKLVPKRAKISISGQNRKVVPVPKQGGTGTP